MLNGSRVLLAIALVTAVLIGGMNAEDAQKAREIEEILFRSDGGGVGYVNGTDEADNATTMEGSSGHGQTTSTVSEEERVNHGVRVPVRIGNWMVLGCHNNEDSWGCELSRLTQISTLGMIDTLKFVMLKDKSLKMTHCKERCESCVAGRANPRPLRIILVCPRQKPCGERMLNRLKTVHFQTGFLCGLVTVLAMLFCCVCMCKVASGAPKPGNEEKARFISKKAVSTKL